MSSTLDISYPYQPKPKKKYFFKIFISFLIVSLIAGSGIGGFIYGSKKTEAEFIKGEGLVLNKDQRPAYLSRNVDFKLFNDVMQAVKDEYIEKGIPETQLFYGALSGVVASLGDPYSVFFEPKSAQEFQSELSGTFEGIGAEIGVKNDRLTVVAPLTDSPAEKAGLRAGDKIFAIDETDTTGIAVDKAVSLIRGPKGTKVVLTIFNNDDKEPRKIEITRAPIIVKSVQSRMEDNNIAYVKISTFGQDTTTEFVKALNNLLAKNPKSLILDLRNNPGGYLSGAIEIASFWLSNDQIVVQEKGNERQVDNSFKEITQKHNAIGQSPLKDVKTIILVNGGSASASEIVAGALQDYKKATLVGEKTFGKGSVQSLKDLSDGSSIKLTIAKWFTPLGRGIDKEGIEPDVKVELTKDDYNSDKDPQLSKALEMLDNE